MRRRQTLWRSDERGGTLVLVALSMFLLLGMAALAVDMSAAFAWRAEAQKIADASALAGASAFLDFMPDNAEPVANDRAYEYALKHSIKGADVDSAEVTVQVLKDEQKVRVWINRTDMPTWFANILGFNGVDIGAMAAAQATDAGAARCLKPLALPDMWFDMDDDDSPKDNIWQPVEDWQYGSDPADRYERYRGPGVNEGTATGYGSDLRGPDRDYGRRIQLKASDPNDTYNFTPGIFFPWRLPPDSTMEQCDKGGGGSQDAGGATYRKNLCECNRSPIQLSNEDEEFYYDLEPGNMIGPTFQGIRELIEEDPFAQWDPNYDNGEGEPPGAVVRNGPNGLEYVGKASPRVIKIALFDPRQITSSGMQQIKFNNFALMFLEEQKTNQDPIQARFLYWADGEEGEVTGSLVKYLRLVE